MEYDFAPQSLKTEETSMATLTDQQRANIAAARERHGIVRGMNNMNVSGTGTAGNWNFQNGQMNIGGMNYGRIGEVFAAQRARNPSLTPEQFLQDFGADAQYGNAPGLLGPQPWLPQGQSGQSPGPGTGGLLGGPGLDNGMGTGPSPGGLLPGGGQNMPPGLPMTGSPAFPQPGMPIQPGNLGDPNMGPFPPGAGPNPGGLPTPGAGTPPGSYPPGGGLPGGGPPRPPGGQQFPVPLDYDPNLLAAYGMTRGPNGEIIPIMMRQGGNPYQMPPGGLLGGGGQQGGGLPLSPARAGLLGGGGGG